MLSILQFKNFILNIGEKPFRVKQIFKHYYRDGVRNFSSVSDLPKNIRDPLTEFISEFEPKIPTIEKIASSSDGTEKVIFKTHDGYLFESVFIPHEKRNTICISCQIGCPVKCAFCLTGTLGFKRNLEAFEILFQVDFWQKKSKVHNIVYMGQGEPFLNYDPVVDSVETLGNDLAYGFGARHITVSTSGIIPKIVDFATTLRGQANLAISLHAPNQSLREKLVPFARKYTLDDLMSACMEYVKKTNRKIFFEYVMLKGVNDLETVAHECGKLLSVNNLYHLNLMNYNQTNLGFEKTSNNKMMAFGEIVKSYGVPVTIRLSHGEEKFAACGQLGNV